MLLPCEYVELGVLRGHICGVVKSAIDVLLTPLAPHQTYILNSVQLGRSNSQ